MKVSVIEELVKTASVQRLIEAEMALVNEKPSPLEVEGRDEGEKLTHILAAIWIREFMESTSTDFQTALREYTQQVRETMN